MPLPRRPLLAGLGLALASPAIIRTPGLLMSIHQPRSLRLLTTADLDWTMELSDYTNQVVIGAQFRASDSAWLRCATSFSLFEVKERGKGVVEAEARIAVLNEMNRIHREGKRYAA